MRRFFDTNVLVYSRDSSDRAKQNRARTVVSEAMGEDDFIVSTQVLMEFYATCMRRRLLGAPEALELVHLWSGYDTVAHTPDLIVRALELHQAHSMSPWDALIVQAAVDARCEVLFTEDLQHGRRFGTVEIVNPFLATTHEPAARYGRIAAKRKGSRQRARA